MDKSEQCKEQVWRGYHTYQCERKAVRDGFCNQHHPDTVKARNEASQKKSDEEYARKLAIHEAPGNRIASLEAACRDALAHVEAGHSMEAAQVLREALDKEKADGQQT